MKTLFPLKLNEKGKNLDFAINMDLGSLDQIWFK